MIYVPVQHLQPNMVLARGIPSGDSHAYLVTGGQVLTQRIIDRLDMMNIPGVYVDMDFSDDITPNDIYDPEAKRHMMSTVKGCFNDYSQSSTLSSSGANAIENMVSQMLDNIFDSPECLLNVVKISDYDDYTFTHSINVATIAVIVGIKNNLTESCLRHLAMAGVLHDIGKVELPISIIQKPAKLNVDEFEQIKEHPGIAYRRLSGSPQIPAAVVQAIKYHHERYDGTGYREGLSGKSIPLYSRILAMADVYDALTSQRTYRKAWMPHEAIEYMLGNSGTHFDPVLLESFLKVILPYPVGTPILLSNGSIAVVSKNYTDFPNRPLVKVVHPLDKKGMMIDLAYDYKYLSVTVQSAVSDDSFPIDLLIKDHL